MTGRNAFNSFLENLKAASEKLSDIRTGSNTKYSMSEIMLSAYSCFHMQSQSFLSHQNLMEKTQGKNNARSLFGIDKIPTDNHIRTHLDEQTPRILEDVYIKSLQWLDENNKLDTFKGINDNLLVALDGTEFFTSDKIGCNNCSTKKQKDGSVRNFHSAITPAIVAINNSNVIPLPAEFITPQDGHDKQDCENAAGKRWLGRHKDILSDYKITILGDDLYSRVPLCESVLEAGFNYLFVCKYTSHKYLKEWIDDCDSMKDLSEFTEKVKKGKKSQKYIYRFRNNVPLNGSKNSIEVNWIELIIKNETGKTTSRFSFITNHTVTRDNVKAFIESGRCRWKIENENNNTLKTKGYNIEHNYGHGAKNLANFLLSLNILSFLCHTMMDLCDKRYKLIRKTLPTRRKFFTDIEALTTYMYFDDWNKLMIFMIRGLELEDPGG